jgi:hypothetical protein
LRGSATLAFDTEEPGAGLKGSGGTAHAGSEHPIVPNHVQQALNNALGRQRPPRARARKPTFRLSGSRTLLACAAAPGGRTHNRFSAQCKRNDHLPVGPRDTAHSEQ